MGAHIRILVLLVTACSAVSAQAEELSIASLLVKSGYFQAQDCKPTADPKSYNECVCLADIKKPVVSGLSSEVGSRVNENLALLPEKLATESCEGDPIEAPKDGLKVNLASAGYEIAYQTPAILTVLIKYSTYGAGSEHPLDGTEGFTLDLTTGDVVDPIARMKPEQIMKADAFIRQELVKKYAAVIYDEARNRADPYLTENGCDTCTIYYGKDGWIVRFQLSAVAPYATGEPEVIIPADLIPPPDKLKAKENPDARG